MTDDEVRIHLVADHDVPADLANRLGHNGLVFMHVGAHEADGTAYDG